MASTRRSPRSRRVLAAVGLLIVAFVVTTAAIVVSTVPALVAASSYSVVAGIVAARLMSDELVRLRRAWAHDRATLARGHRRTAVARAEEHLAFAEQMGSRIRLREAQIAELRESLLTAEIDLALAREKVSAERARSAALEADLESAESDLESARIDLGRAQDALAASESAELAARAEILAWEDAASEEQRHMHERKLA